MVFYALVIVLVTQLLSHPRLGLCQCHAMGYDEDQAQTFGAWGDVCHHYAQVLLTWCYLCPTAFGIGDMVQVVDAQSRWYGVLVLATSVTEGGVRCEDRQLLLHRALDVLVLLWCYFATLFLLQGILDFGTDATYVWRIYCLSQQFRGAYLHHLTLHVVCYSKCHIFNRFKG